MKKIPYLHILLFICIVGLVSTPTLVFAQVQAQGCVGQINNGFCTFSGIITTFTQTIVRSLATLFATAAMVAFFYGIVQFIWGSRDGKPEVMTKGKSFMVWGLVSLFVMFSVWGIVNYAQRIFGIQGQNTIIIPQIELGNGKAPTNSGSQGLPTGGNSTPVPTSPSQGGSGACIENQACTIPGWSGSATCSRNDEGTLGCYANSSAPQPCPNEYEVRDSNGNCFAPAVY